VKWSIDCHRGLSDWHREVLVLHVVNTEVTGQAGERC